MKWKTGGTRKEVKHRIQDTGPLNGQPDHKFPGVEKKKEAVDSPTPVKKPIVTVEDIGSPASK